MVERNITNENTPEVKNNSGEGLRWHFWFLAAFSAFLFVTFVLYLPLRFYHEAAGPAHHPEEAGETDKGGGPAHAEGALHGAHGVVLYHEEGEVNPALERGALNPALGIDANATVTPWQDRGAFKSGVKAGLAVQLNISPVPFRTGQTETLDFFVNEKPESKPVPVSSLEIEHTKPMHVIGVRNDMNEFFHIHPVFISAPGHLSVDYVFSKPGLYKIWSEIKKDGVNHTFGHPEVAVGGEGKNYEKEVTEARNVIAGNYQVALKTGEAVKGRESDLSFAIRTLTGGGVKLGDYLGAKMHLTIIKDDWKQFIHTHPEGGGNHHALLKSHFNRGIREALAHGPGEEEEIAGEELNFHVTFPEAGLYKMFAQFRPEGIDLPADEALTASFWIRVAERGALPVSPWWINLIWASAAIVILSWVTRRYLRAGD